MSFLIVLLVLRHSIENRCTIKHSLLMAKTVDRTRYNFYHRLNQEPITRSVQLPDLPVTAFSQTDLFLVWIYREFRPPWESRLPIKNTDFHHFNRRLKGKIAIFFFLSMFVYFERNYFVLQCRHIGLVWKLHAQWLVPDVTLCCHNNHFFESFAVIFLFSVAMNFIFINNLVFKPFYQWVIKL